VVSYLEGDPDRPLITGVVYNDEQMPPYTLPDEKTKSYLKTNTSKGGEGYNELRFEDKKGSEQIFVHGEKDMDVCVKNDSRENIGNSRHETIGGEKNGTKSGDHLKEVFRDQHLKVHHDRCELIGNYMQLEVGGIDGGTGDQHIVIHGQKAELVEKDSGLGVGGDLKEDVGGTHSLNVGGAEQVKVGSYYALEAGMEIHLKALTLILEADMQLSLKVGGNFIDISPAGIAIQGAMVLINSGGAPGTGSGAKPAEPDDIQMAFIQAPAAADDSKTGQKSTPF
jgi:type VI secretion system secreted protein VgrG